MDHVHFSQSRESVTEIRNAFATHRGILPFSSESFDAYTTAQSSFDIGL